MLAGEYRAKVADLATALTGVSVPRARAELRKLVGEVRVEETEEAVTLWAAHSAEQALMRVAGGSQQIRVVAGVGFGFNFPAHDPPRRPTRERS